jgi:hypothetical protein
MNSCNLDRLQATLVAIITITILYPHLLQLRYYTPWYLYIFYSWKCVKREYYYFLYPRIFYGVLKVGTTKVNHPL